MKNVKLLTIIATCLLVTSIFAVIPAFSVQPPIDASTYYIGTIGQPSRMDPARAYDTASGELLQNIYQTLIWWNDTHPVTFNATGAYNLTTADYANLTQYKPVLCTEVPTFENLRITTLYDDTQLWNFTINTSAVFQPWKNESSGYEPERTLTAADVVYTFQRAMIYDSPYAPTWMLFEPAFGIMGWDDKYPDMATNPTQEAAAATMIQNWVNATGNDVIFHWFNPWAPGVIRQILAQTWGGILNKDFVQRHGGWDGNWTTCWAALYRRQPTISRSELDQYKDNTLYGAVVGDAHPGSYYTGAGHDLPAACGTGPYNFTSVTGWDKVNKIWRIDAFHDYWLNTWNSGTNTWTTGNHVTSVIEKGIDAYPTRKMLFLQGEFDVAVIPRANMYDVLADTYNPLPGINLVYNVANLANDVMLFTMNVSTAYPYQSYVGAPSHLTGAEPYFFNNTHMRRAFAWALNYTEYIHSAWFDEALIQNTWWVDGLSPESFKNTALPQRTLNYTMIKNELDQAIIDTYNISNVGFETTITYNIGNDQRMICMQDIAQAFTTLSAMTGKTYKVNVVGLDWPVFLDAMNAGGLALYDVGWLADFADADNFCRTYQHSAGPFPVSQGTLNKTAGGDRTFPPDQEIVDKEVDEAIVETNETIRKDLYWDLQQRYWSDCISFPLYQPVGRRFARDWVQGWYYNSLYPGLYAYDIYKQELTGLTSVNLNIQNSLVPIVNYTQIYIFHSQMRIGGGLGNGTNGITPMKWFLSAERLDNNTDFALLYSSLGLTRTPGEQANAASSRTAHTSSSGRLEAETQRLIGTRTVAPR